MPVRYEFRFQIQEEGVSGIRTLVLAEGETMIGRMPDNGIMLEHRQVSRQHARVFCTAQDCQITDLKSANKTYINGVPLEPEVPKQLEPGAEVRIATFTLTLQRIEREVQPIPVMVEEAEAGEKGRPRPGPTSASGLAHRIRPMPLPRDEDFPPFRVFIRPGQIFEKKYMTVEKPKKRCEEDPFKQLRMGPESRQLIRYLPAIYQVDYSDEPDSDAGGGQKTESLHNQKANKKNGGKHRTKKGDVLLSMPLFLGAFESILLPLEWIIENFDLFLNVNITSGAFLAWLATWFGVEFPPGLSEEQERAFLRDAHLINNRMGTKWALSRVLEIVTGVEPEIIEFDEKLDADTFCVRIPPLAKPVSRAQIEDLIQKYKPAHTGFLLELQ